MSAITITVDVNAADLERRLAKARALVTLLEEAERLVGELVGGSAPSPAPQPIAQTPPRSAPATNGSRPGRPSGSAPTAKRPRRAHSDETKAAAVVRARQVGATRAAEEFDVVPSVVRNWIKAHPKEHAVAEPIKGTPVRDGEDREAWEARKRDAAGASL